VTCHPWSLKITILGTKRVSKKMGAYQTCEKLLLLYKFLSSNIDNYQTSYLST
jgi:hypothetical protein